MEGVGKRAKELSLVEREHSNKKLGDEEMSFLKQARDLTMIEREFLDEEYPMYHRNFVEESGDSGRLLGRIVGTPLGALGGGAAGSFGAKKLNLKGRKPTIAGATGAILGSIAGNTIGAKGGESLGLKLGQEEYDRALGERAYIENDIRSTNPEETAEYINMIVDKKRHQEEIQRNDEMLAIERQKLLEARRANELASQNLLHEDSLSKEASEDEEYVGRATLGDRMKGGFAGGAITGGTLGAATALMGKGKPVTKRLSSGVKRGLGGAALGSLAMGTTTALGAPVTVPAQRGVASLINNRPEDAETQAKANQRSLVNAGITSGLMTGATAAGATGLKNLMSSNKSSKGKAALIGGLVGAVPGAYGQHFTNQKTNERLEKQKQKDLEREFRSQLV